MLDYSNNKVGIAEKRELIDTGIIDVVSLVRFICFVFLFGNFIFMQAVPLSSALLLFKDASTYSSLEGNMERLLKRVGKPEG